MVTIMPLTSCKAISSSLIPPMKTSSSIPVCNVNELLAREKILGTLFEYRSAAVDWEVLKFLKKINCDD